MHSFSFSGPWINNCVGAYNQKYFLQFLVWVGISSLYAGIIALYAWLATCFECDRDPEAVRSRALYVILFIFSIQFSFFEAVKVADHLRS